MRDSVPPSEYKRLRGTKALKLAVHDTWLAIMALDSLRYSSCAHGTCSNLKQTLPRQDPKSCAVSGGPRSLEDSKNYILWLSTEMTLARRNYAGPLLMWLTSLARKVQDQIQL